MSIETDCIKCPRCEVYIQKENFNKHKNSKRCKELEEGKENRKRAMQGALRTINRLC